MSVQRVFETGFLQETVFLFSTNVIVMAHRTPVQILNAWAREEVSQKEIVDWACQTISRNQALADDPLWMDIAVIDENDCKQLARAPDLLRRLIAATVDFQISPEQLAADRVFANECMENPEATIAPDHFWRVVLGLIPQVAPHWARHLAENCGERTGLYIDEIAVLIQYAVDQIRDGNTDKLSAIGNLIELLTTLGDDATRELVTIGFLEGVTNQCGHDPGSLPVERLVGQLGETSIGALQDLGAFWGTRTPGAES